MCTVFITSVFVFVFELHMLCLYISHVLSLDEWLFCSYSFLFHCVVVHIQKAQGFILTVVTTL
jgi:hypothetical protein